MSSLLQLYVRLGACYEGDTFQKCAFESSDCGDTDIFVTSDELEVSALESDSVFADGVQCYDNSKDGIELEFTGTQGTMGRCTKEEDIVHCTNKAKSCVYPSDYQPFDQFCTLHQDLNAIDNDDEVSETPFTRFPVCMQTGNEKAKVCVWSKDDCLRDDLGTFSAAVHRECDCSNVHTGACRLGNNFKYCATSYLACEGEDYHFLSIREVLTAGIDCRLCKGKNNEFLTDGFAAIVPDAYKDNATLPGVTLTPTTAKLQGVPTNKPTNKASFLGITLPGGYEEIPLAGGEIFPMMPKTLSPTSSPTSSPTYVPTTSPTAKTPNPTVRPKPSDSNSRPRPSKGDGRPDSSIVRPHKTRDPTPQPTLMPGTKSLSASEDYTKNSPLAGIIVGITLTVFILIGVGMYGFMQKKKSKSRPRTATGLNLLPDGTGTMKGIEKVDEGNEIY